VSAWVADCAAREGVNRGYVQPVGHSHVGVKRAPIVERCYGSVISRNSDERYSDSGGVGLAPATQ
jgi:hypothetical protein